MLFAGKIKMERNMENYVFKITTEDVRNQELRERTKIKHLEFHTRAIEAMIIEARSNKTIVYDYK